jgi:hypothetical protein
LKATAAGADTVLSLGIYHKDPKKACTRNLKPADVDGQWKTYDIGLWSPGEDGGNFYIATGKDGAKEAYLDCLWWFEEPVETQ